MSRTSPISPDSGGCFSFLFEAWHRFRGGSEEVSRDELVQRFLPIIREVDQDFENKWIRQSLKENPQLPEAVRRKLDASEKHVAK